ncbi:TPA: DpnD/PcfM family protein [Streptococcus agalactiae]|nr:DpnD/PcfM family protein [Streptococcus agalactiae]HEO2267425.1 DpnD/PcfM family protein [Streptococcus agalactiae]HEO7770427.1 DpnD/PcfM family protein [Streptococcus agalactiae]
MENKQYTVRVKEVLIRDIEIVATSQEEAEQFIEDRYKDQGIILDDSDYNGVDITTIDELAPDDLSGWYDYVTPQARDNGFGDY